MINIDWKKQAAQVLDEKEVERAFMDQAYNFISNKAGPLMEDPHRLGFEVVYTDEDHTRMVGIFAFRVNQELLYAPVFFLNGQIRGTDLLYTHDKKMFRPLNKAWATYLVEKQKDDMGMGIARSETRKMPMDIELSDIASPPGSYAYKSAAEEEAALREMFTKLANSFTQSMDSDVKALIRKYLDKQHTTDNPKPEDATCKEVKDKREEEVSKPEQDDIADGNVKKSFLRKFIVEDGGIEAVEKLASWMSENKRFAELLVTHVRPEDYMPPELVELAKSASAPAPKLVLYTGGVEAFTQIPLPDMTKSASAQEEFFSKGYYLWDDRAPGDLNPATKDLTVELCKPGEPGIYKILLADGTMKEAILAAPAQQRFSENQSRELYSTHPDAWECSQWSRDEPRELIAVLKDDGSSGTVRRVHGEYVKSMSDAIRDNELETEMSSGKTYRVYDAEAGVLSEVIYCVGSRTENDLKIYRISNRGKAFEIRQNKDHDNSSFDGNFLGKHIFFVPVSTENPVRSEYDSYDKVNRYRFWEKELPRVGNDTTLTQWILETGVKQASFVRNNGDSNLFSLRAGPRKQTRFMPRPAFAAKMARDLGMHARSVEYFLDKAAAEGQAHFFLGEPGIEKYAAPIQLVDEEYFRNDYDPEFNVAMDYPQAFQLGTETDAPVPPERRIGDAYDPGMGMTAEDGRSLSTGAILGVPAEQLEQLREQAGVPNVFEHGLVGSLIHTYDSVAMIDKYIPDLESALDRLGRLLFLYYWKPRDFEDAYGADDMANLENQLLSTFQSFGELVLELLKKSENRRGASGNVSMFSAN